MNRRKFLRNVAYAGAAVVAVPHVLTDEYPFVASGTVEFGKNLVCDPAKFIIHYSTQTIEFTDEHKNGIQLWQLYKYLQEEWKDDEPIPFKYPLVREFGPEYNYKKVWTSEK